jgi:outer membrane protein assembly factor BamB/tetratricopeptide (TPR) repeat protein
LLVHSRFPVNAKLIIFCPQCETLVFDEASCENCGWQRPLSDAAPGTILWQTSLTGRLGEPYSQLATANNLLCVGLETGQRSTGRTYSLVALDLVTGQEEWRYHLPDGHLTQTPVATTNYLLLGTQELNPLPQPDNALLALNLKGELAWTSPVPAHSLSAPAMKGERLFFSANNGCGYIVSLADGHLQAQAAGLPTWTSAVPAVGENAFFIGSRSPHIAAISAEDAQVTTLFRAENSETWFTLPLVYHQGVVYAAGWDKHLYAIDAQTGSRNWRSLLGRGISSPPVVGPYLYVGVKELNKDGRPTYALHALSLDSGELAWRFQTDKHVEAPAAVKDDLVFISSRSGHFYALDAQTGECRWQLTLEARIVTPPVLVGDNLYCGTRDGQILAIAWRKQEARTELLPAESYRAEQNWEMAGIAAVLSGNWLAAAADFERLDHPYAVAQLYEQAGAWEQAAANYRTAERPHEAIAAYRRVGDQVGEAEILLELNDLPAAAALYENAGRYTEAATILEQAGLLDRAVTCYVQANKLREAAALYLKLDQLAAAADLYQQVGDVEQAVTVLQEAGLIAEAANVLVADGRSAEAATLLEQFQQIEAAAVIWQEQGNWQAAAQVYERDQQWGRAAELYVQNNDLEQAAKLYEQDNQLSRAAELYIRLKATRRATALYQQIQDAAEVARLAEQNEDWLMAANAYLVMRPIQPLEAARCFRLAEQWEKAAQLYEKLGDLEQAVPLWLQAGQPAAAVAALRQAGQLVAAAELWEEQGRYGKAAELWLELDKVDESIRLFQLAGKNHKVLDLLESQGNWQQVRLLAHELQEHEREALACVELLDSALPHETIELHFLAAQAFQTAANASEQAGRQQAAAIAVLWEKAAFHFEQAFDSEKVAECEQNVNRLRRWPELQVQLQAGQTLVAEEWHTLTARVINVGYGAAATISLRVISGNFAGDDLSTRQFRGLREGQELELPLRVWPRKEAVGSSVPLDIEVEYLRPDKTVVTRQIRGQVSVRRPETPATPVVSLLDMAETPAGDSTRPVLRDERLRLYNLLTQHFDEEELRTLCFSLSVNYDDLRAAGRAGKARELVIYLERRGRLDELMLLCQQERPHVAWNG